MIKSVLELLQLHEWLNCSENIDIAKGKYELPKTFKKATKKIKREWQSRK
jgi:hypothetical protein